jgi:hypothetical protein
MNFFSITFNGETVPELKYSWTRYNQNIHWRATQINTSMILFSRFISCFHSLFRSYDFSSLQAEISRLKNTVTISDEERLQTVHTCIAIAQKERESDNSRRALQ